MDSKKMYEMSKARAIKKIVKFRSLKNAFFWGFGYCCHCVSTVILIQETSNEKTTTICGYS